MKIIRIICLSIVFLHLSVFHAGSLNISEAVDTLTVKNEWSQKIHFEQTWHPITPMSALPLPDIKPKGWIKQQMLRDITSGNYSDLDNMRKLMSPVTTHDANRGYGEFEGNFMDGVVRNAFLTGYEPWLEKAKGMADFLVENQDDMGYIGRRNPGTFQELARLEGELWGQCCFLRGLLAYYEYSQDKKYLNTAIRSVDYMIQLFGDESNRYFIGESTMEGGARAHGLNYIDVLEKLYMLTGNKRYVDFAFRLYEDYSNAINLKNVDNQMAYLLDAHLPYLHHAPHVAEHTRLVYWLHSMTSDIRYKRASLNSLDKFKRALSPSGGLVTDSNILESVGGKYGTADLRYEYCSLLESAISFSFAFRTFGDIALAETAENIVFNAAQAARFADGKAVAYCSKDNQIEAVGTPDNYTFRYQYAACHRIACCVYNAGRIMPHYVANMWYKTTDGESLVAAFYGPSEVKTRMKETTVIIDQKTIYPFENDINMTIGPSSPVSFDIILRNPSWSKNTRVVAEGAKIVFEDGFIRLSKLWKKGDQIHISFEPRTEVRVSFSNDLFVKRGALLYALRIPHVKEATKVWDNAEFANYNIFPAGEEEKDRYREYKLPLHTQINVLTDSTLFIYKKNTGASPDFPFDQPYGRIITSFVYNNENVQDELVPIGSTVLRKTTFPEGRTR